MTQKQTKTGGFSNAKVTETKATNQSSAPSAKDTVEKIEQLTTVKVIHGANDGQFPVVGSKVQKVRASLVDAFNIPGDALAFVNGEQVDANYVLQANDSLEFIKAAGVKGRCSH